MAEDNPLQPPSWLDRNFIFRCLEKEGCFTECEIKPAIGVGENYSGDLFRVTLKSTTEETRRIVVKCISQEASTMQRSKQWGYFENESDMLMRVLPKMRRILEEVGLPARIAPVGYHSSDSPQDFVMMEDLCESGYRGGDRLNGLDTKHCLLVLETLAGFHAASLRVIEEDPSLKEQYEGGFFDERNADIIGRMYDSAIDKFLSDVDSWSERKYSDKAEGLRSTMRKKVFAAARRRDDCLNVLNHGDLWTNNMMFAYSGQEPTGVTFVDFQMSTYNSPANDLLYFLFTSPRNDVRLPHLDDFLAAYHKRFTAVCRALSLDTALSLEDLKAECQRRLIFGFSIAISVFPITCAPVKDAIKPGTRKENEGFGGLTLFRNSRYIDGMLKCLPYFEKNGIF